MKEYTVAILGATGAVGQEMRKRLEERNFPVGEAEASGQHPERRKNRDVPRPKHPH